ncbi:MAG: FHA domain-containing protein [Verrucomicrobiota bacterium]|nr:FHA domain-containing protein [Verrucomicrobiota bacterium]
MVQLQILSGKKAGAQIVARHFPFQAGRSSVSHLCLDEPGVWENHFEIALPSPDGFVLTAQPNAFVMVNGKNIQQTNLENGDLIEIGLLKMRFGLSATRQTGLKIRELFTWMALALLPLGQIALIYWLI